MPFDDGKKTVSGAIAHTDDAAAKVPFVSVKCGIAPTLSGVSSVVCTQAGKNLLDTAIAETKTNNSVSVICDGNGKYTATGTATGGSANITFMLKTPCEIKSGMYLHLMNSGAVGSVAITLQKQDNTTIYAPSLSPANRIADLSSYVGETIYFIRFYVANGASFEMTLTPMLCFSNTATTFEPYQTPTQYTADLGRTIYGGTVDVVNGEGKETHNYIDMGNLSWTYHAPSGNLSAYFDTYLPNDAKLGNSQTAFDGYTADYTSIKSTQIALSGYDDMVMALGHGSRHFFLCDQRYSDANALTTALTGKILVYPLATPTDFTFTPITPTPETVGKVNNVYCDTGNTELTYYDNAHGFSEVTVNKNGVSQTAYLHKIVYGGQADVVRGTCEPKNLLPMTNYDGGVYNPDVGRQLNLTVSQTQFEKTGGVYSVSTTSTWKTFTVLFPIISGATYHEKWTLSVESGQQGSTRAYLDEDFKVLFKYNNNISGPITTNMIMTPPTGAKYLAITWTNRGTAVQTLNITEPQIENGTSASDFTPNFEPFTFPPISIGTDEGENTLFANEGTSVITYRKETE